MPDLRAADLRWRPGLENAEVASATELLAEVNRHDGRAPVSEHVLLHLRAGGDADAEHLLAYADGTLVGLAHLDVTDRVAGAAGELAVRPSARGRGVATAMVRELLARTERDGLKLRLWAHGEHPAAVALAERLGFVRVRVLWQLRRSLLAPLGPVELPDGVRLRPFVVGADEAEFLRVNNAAFDWHPEQGGWDLAQVKLRETEPWFDPEGFLLAVDEADRVLGFHWTKVHGGSASGGHAHDPIGEVYVLGVDPAARGRRLGAGLTLAGLHHLRDRGLREVMLYVEADNDAAVRVYRDLGFTQWDSDVSFVR